MRYEAHLEERPATNGLEGQVIVLEDTKAGNRAEIWPALGCNCYRWQVPADGKVIDILYSAPNLFDDNRPTRSGIPVLFPFPNRIRDGVYEWNGKTYQLPKSDPTKTNAIHGFACHHPWRVLEQGGDNEGAWLTAEFHARADAPTDADLWPADHRIRITFRLGEQRLSLTAVVDNPDQKPLPFGLGYHPYFRTPLISNARRENCKVQANADTYWELVENLPTGKKLSVDEARDLRYSRAVTELTLDDVLCVNATPGEQLPVVAKLRQAPDGGEMRLRASPSFRELVVFTPPHREAFCLEPYTCTTDAVNLQARGIDAGWKVLPAGEKFEATVVLEYAR
jgi:aldose 1-epimerase